MTWQTNRILSRLRLTSVWTSCERCSRILETNPNTSTFCSAWVMSIMASITMKVPVLPTPALQEHTKQTTDWMNPQSSADTSMLTWVKQRDICACKHAYCYSHSKCFQPQLAVCFPEDTQSRYLSLNTFISIETNWIIKTIIIVDPSKQQNNKQWLASSAFWYLQWTTIGPEKGRLTTLTFLRNLSMPMGEKGTPKSGQLVKWSWVTSLGVLAASLACYIDTQTEAGTRLTGGDLLINQEPLSKQ